MIIDVHAHIWDGRFERDRETILRAIERYNISRVYVSGLSAEYIPSEEQVTVRNRAAACFVRDYPELIGGLVYVSPEHKNALEVVRRGIEEQGFEGIKLWVSAHCDDACVDPIAEAAAEYRAPMLIHAFRKSTGQCANESTAKNVAALARRHPETKIIMAHLGGDCYDGIPQIRDLKNVSVDISGSIFNGGDVDYAVKNLGAERVMFGTDMPGSFLVNYGQILEARLTPKERHMILYENAKRMFSEVRR